MLFGMSGECLLQGLRLLVFGMLNHLRNYNELFTSP